MRGNPAQVIAACFGLAAFVVAIVAGAASGTATTQVLIRALIAMSICYPLGLAAGLICNRVVDDHLEANTKVVRAPQPPEPEPAVTADTAEDEEDVLVI